jgi:hypothetical protein
MGCILRWLFPFVASGLLIRASWVLEIPWVSHVISIFFVSCLEIMSFFSSSFLLHFVCISKICRISLFHWGVTFFSSLLRLVGSSLNPRS